ncbi:hypothetical protein [Spiroplasma endosymbiont of Aleiodes alternator]|uniref:hypothetical protein n=1 Tax=Spiroplasma endosymbiont of Aleiodes alternator TaxID=3139329 RepID=UPI003CCB6E7A
MNTFLKVFLTQRLQFCVYFILDVQSYFFSKILNIFLLFIIRTYFLTFCRHFFTSFQIKNPFILLKIKQWAWKTYFFKFFILNFLF